MFEKIGEINSPLGKMSVEGDRKYGVVQFCQQQPEGSSAYNVTYVCGDRIKLIESSISDLGFTITLDKETFNKLYDSYEESWRNQND